MPRSTTTIWVKEGQPRNIELPLIWVFFNSNQFTVRFQALWKEPEAWDMLLLVKIAKESQLVDVQLHFMIEVNATYKTKLLWIYNSNKWYLATDKMLKMTQLLLPHLNSTLLENRHTDILFNLPRQ